MPAAALTPATAAALLAAQRYDPAILPALEAYVQAGADAYDIDAYMATVSALQFAWGGEKPLRQP